MNIVNKIPALLISIIIIMSFLFTSKVMTSEKIGTLFSLSKDVMFLFICLVAFIIFLKSFKLRVNALNLLIIIYLLILLFYAAISPLGNIAFKGALQMIYAPLLFLLLQYFYIPPKRFEKVLRYCYYFFLLLIVSSLIIYWLIGQNLFYDLIGLKQYYIQMGNENMIYGLTRFTNTGAMKYRLTGLLISPVEMSVVSMFTIIISMFFVANKKIRLLIISLSFLTLFMSGGRSIIVGIFFAFWTKKILEMPVLLRSLAIVATIGISVLIISFVISNDALWKAYLDPSAAIHLYDLFIKGPEEALRNWQGIGIGMSGMLGTQLSAQQLTIERIHIESEYLMMIVQIGVFGFLIYFFIICAVIKKLFLIKRSSLCSAQMLKKTDAAIMIVLSVHYSALTIASLSSRLIVTFMWLFVFLVINEYQFAKKVNRIECSVGNNV